MALDLTSSSTDAQVSAAYDDNADYDLVSGGSVEKARNFAQALRLLVRRGAEEMQKGNERMRDTWLKYQNELEQVMRWLARNDPNNVSGGKGTVTYFDFRNFR